MELFSKIPVSSKKQIRYVLSDIDDTLTFEGQLPSVALSSMERLQNAGLIVIPITGRPAGWCDYMARMWPVKAVIGENGAFYYRYGRIHRQMIRRYWKSSSERLADQKKLWQIRKEILKQVPECRISADQSYRETDLAIDFCEDVTPLSQERVLKIVECFKRAGAKAKISSIHVNGWYGTYNKLMMTRKLFKE